MLNLELNEKAFELPQSCTKPSILYLNVSYMIPGVTHPSAIGLEIFVCQQECDGENRPNGDAGIKCKLSSSLCSKAFLTVKKVRACPPMAQGIRDSPTKKFYVPFGHTHWKFMCPFLFSCALVGQYQNYYVNVLSVPFKSSLSNSFEYWAPVDEIYRCPIFKWVAETWPHCMVPLY